MSMAVKQRAAIINRMARAIAFQGGRTWERMTAARQAQIRTEVIVALRAMSPVWPAYEEFVALSVSQALPEASLDPYGVARVVEAYIAEVLA